jgi:arabinofuranosyltransferase
VPEGYLETLATGHNQIADASLAALWDDLARVTRDPLFTAARWRAILRLNLMSLPHQPAVESTER